MDTTRNIEQAITKKLLSAIGKEIDVPKLAKKLAPQVERAITKAVLDKAARMEIDDFVSDVMGKEFYKMMEQVLVSALKDKLNK